MFSTRAITAALAVLVTFSLGTPVLAAPAKRDQTQIARQAQEEARARAEQRGSIDDSQPRRSTRGDGSRLPRMHSPMVHARPKPSREPVIGWSSALGEPEFDDRRRRLPAAPVPKGYIPAIHVGERFVFDVYFAGNPAGLAEAGVVEYQADPRGDAPQGSGMYRLEGQAVTSGVVSLLASMEDRMITWIDAGDGAVISSVNILDRAGLGVGKGYKRRVTEIEYEGRGSIRITDAKDEKTTKMTRQVPRNTFDPLSAMAWVRSLDLAEGETVSAHAMDGKVLLKVEVIGRGKAKLDPMPSVAQGLGVSPDDVHLLEGTLSWVDRYGTVREDLRKYSFRAYVTHDDRRLLLAIETDMWLGVLKLVLNRYDPPSAGHGGAGPSPRPD
ncbi:hypothetical protein DB30_07782 [Enhygromyxa salina]|uniref:Uncharacterized protein n=1 Tax=Enhygromyxa salina TaxID=215803 RepID=A0A0C2DGG8_9BACT|nr:DUF3108 domain-containing protein [Enhygromyxa salina]KIG18767.1 hypothetical protein DB30_07782 [Enhygromyxa salina]